jgi:membrane protease YdiL (CAAX protease family)
MQSELKWYLDWVFWLAIAAGPFVLLVAIWSGIKIVPSTQNASLSWWVILTTVALYPVLEEYVFRGLLQRYLLQKTKHYAYAGLSLANVIASIAFCLAHLLYRTPVIAVAVFLPSLIFGFARDRYDRLAPSIVLHSVYNLSYLIALKSV